MSVSICVSLLDQRLQVCTIMASTCISKYFEWLPQSKYVSLPNHGVPMQLCTGSILASIHVHFQCCFISASKCITRLTGSWPLSRSPSSLDRCLAAHLWVRWIMTSFQVHLHSLNTSVPVNLQIFQMASPGAPRIALKCNLLQHWIYVYILLNVNINYKQNYVGAVHIVIDLSRCMIDDMGCWGTL